MTYTAPRPFVFRAQRESVALFIGAIAATLMLSYSVHAHRPAAPLRMTQEVWAGGLASFSPTPVAQPSVETVTSASLVVPKSELALPMPVPVRTLIRLHGCEGSACVAKAVAPPAPKRQQVAIGDQLAAAERAALIPPELVRPNARSAAVRATPNFMSRMNPLKHLPDMATIKRPVAYVGDTVTGWFKRF